MKIPRFLHIAAACSRVLNGHTAADRAAELGRFLGEAAEAQSWPVLNLTFVIQVIVKYEIKKWQSYCHDFRLEERHDQEEAGEDMLVTNRKGKTVLVAGGAGFIGSHLIDALLADGMTVVCLDNYLTGRASNLHHLSDDPRFDLVEGDVIDGVPAAIRRSKARFSHIYNLACAASPPHYQADPEHTMLTNVLGTRNLLRLAEEMDARFLLSSTSEVYGDPEVHPQPERYRGWVNCTGPRACYEEGKRAAETLAFDFARTGRADVRVARIFNTYGPRMRPDDGRVVSNVICQALAGEDITIYGDGSQTRSFCYVSDLIDGLMRLMHSEPSPGAPVNLGNPAELTISDLVARVLALTGSASTIVHMPLPTDDPRRRRPDISRARELFGWEPRVDLQQGLEATAAWFAAQREQGSEPADAERELIDDLAAE